MFHRQLDNSLNLIAIVAAVAIAIAGAVAGLRAAAQERDARTALSAHTSAVTLPRIVVEASRSASAVSEPLAMATACPIDAPAALAASTARSALN